MDTDSDWNGSDEEYATKKTHHGRKRRKVSHRNSDSVRPSRRESATVNRSSSPLGLSTIPLPTHDEPDSFEDIIEPLFPDLMEAAAIAQVEQIKYDETGQAVMPMSRLQSQLVMNQLAEHASQYPALAMLHRRLKTHPDEWRSALLGTSSKPFPPRNVPVTPLEQIHTPTVNPEVLDALYAIKTTPYENSFLSRLRGFQPPPKPPVLALDWENRPPWMELMRDIRGHHALMHPEREQPVEVEAPVEYVTLRPSHLDQVHDLLGRAFWAGIDVSDSLLYSPERCTVIATYKKLVVGVALISSPVETYINYLVVRAGWDNSQIATSMLYHLITLNPHRDITLHVSINNPAVLLYNRFGFKAEEFIVGFYEDYLDPQSRASKNAFRLRLRR